MKFVYIILLLFFVGESVCEICDSSKNCKLVGNDPIQKSALMALYESTDGDNWVYPPLNPYKLNGVPWNTTDNFCKWYGIQCSNRTGKLMVIQVALVNCNLNGFVPDDFGKLSNLISLDLSDNLELRFSLPVKLFDNMKDITTIRLANTSLWGAFPEFHNGCSLTSLSISCSDFASINLGNCNYLGYLYANNNKLQRVFSTFDNNNPMPNLFQLELNGNLLDDNSDINITKLVTLRIISILSLAGNQFTGKIPIILSSTLTQLDLSYNQFTEVGSIYAPILSRLDLSFNQFTRLDSNILGYWYTPSLNILNLAYNQISSDISVFEKLIHQTISILNLMGNNFSGNLVLNSLWYLYEIDVRGNSKLYLGTDDRITVFWDYNNWIVYNHQWICAVGEILVKSYDHCVFSRKYRIIVGPEVSNYSQCMQQ